MLKPLHFSYWLFILLFTTQFYAQSALVAPPVKLSFADDKRVFRIGEPIRLTMTFATQSGAFVIIDDIARDFDELILSPREGAFDWKEQIFRLYGGYDDSIGLTDISAKPYNLNFFLNTRIRFDKPGKYSLKINTKRIKPRGDQTLQSRFGGAPVMLSTNTIEFEIVAMSEAEEAEKVRELSKRIDSANLSRENRQTAVKELSFLTGKPSTIEKARRALNDDQIDYRNIINYRYEILNGLYIARDKSPIINVFETAFNDVNRPINSDLVGNLATFRRLREYETEAPAEENPVKNYERENKRRTEIQNEYLEKLFESLKIRTGRSRSFAAFIIFTRLPREDNSSVLFNQTKTIVTDNFDDYNIYSRDWLLNAYWDKIKNPGLISSIKRLLEETKNSNFSIIRATALKRFLELDEKQVRPVFIDEILSPDSFVDIKVLAKLSDKTLPEIDKMLLEQIIKSAESKDNQARFRLNRKSLLAARFATAKIYPDLLKLYQSKESELSFESKSVLLAYLARFNSEKSMPLIEKVLADTKIDSSSFFFYATQVNLAKGIEKVLQKQLFLDSPNHSSTAAYYLSKYGSAKNRKFVEKRYEIWLENRKPNTMESPAQSTKTTTSNNSMYQINIIESLINAKNWNLTEREFQLLKATCLTPTCRDRFGKTRLLTKSEKASRVY